MTFRLDTDGELKNSFKKVERAKKLLDELRSEAVKLVKLANITIVKRKTDTGIEFALQNAEKKPDAGHLSIIAGDIIHNLRSSLDQMASELARLNEKNDSAVYFPFAVDAADLELKIKNKNFDFAGGAAVALIKTFKPFKGGNVLLRCLHDFNIEDKHKNLINPGIQIATPALNLGPNSEPFGTVFPVELSFNCPFDSPLSGKPIIKALEDMVEMIEGILKAFLALIAP